MNAVESIDWSMTSADNHRAAVASDRDRKSRSPRRIELVLEQLDQLPTLPPVAARLIAATSRNDTSARDVIELLESDQALATKLLSLACRAPQGIRKEVNTVRNAVLLLGFATVRTLALSIKVFETFEAGQETPENAFPRTEFWKHSLAVASAARLAAVELGEPFDPEEAFIAGLLHDIGKLALAFSLPKSYDRVVRLSSSRRSPIAAVEKEVIGLDHASAGRRLAERWGLPEKLTHAIWLHHHRGEMLPASVSDRAFIELIYLADLIAREQRIGYSGNWTAFERAADVAREVGLSDQGLDRVTAQLAAQIEERAGIIGLNALTSDRLYLRALASANEELGRLNRELARRNDSLRLRSRFLDALQHLSEASKANASIRDVCCAAAGAMTIANGLDGVLVFFASPSERVWHVGLKFGDAAPSRELVFLEHDDDHLTSIPFGPHTGLIVPVDAEHLVDVPRDWLSALGEPPYWMVPLGSGDRRLGGAVFAATSDQVQQFAACTDELRSLAGAIGLALADAEARTASMRLNEELAETSARMKQVEAELLRTRSLSMIAEMACGAAHELNNPLAVISGRAQLLEAELDDPKHQDALRIVQEHSSRCSQVVTELLELARPTPPQPVSIDLSTMLASIRDAFLKKHELPDHHVEINIKAHAPSIWADENHLRVIIGELLVNGLEAAGDQPLRLVVNCTAELTDDRVVIELVDHGRGMAPADLHRAFDPFFSHRPAGRGRGLGLSRALRLAEINGGRLWLESVQSVGTSAFLSLPRSGLTEEL